MAHILTVTLNAAIDTTLTVPALEVGRSYTAREVVKLPGGKGLNVARTLRGLGLAVEATGLAGGPAGDFIAAGLRAERIAPRFLAIGAASRNCTAVVELERRRVTEINEPGLPIMASEATRFLDLFGELIGQARLVALCGSLPPGLPRDYYTLLLERAHAAGVPAVLDTSGDALEQGIDALPLLVKPNATEAGTLLGTPVRGVDDARRAGEALRRRGARLVAITLGDQGAVLSTEMGSWWAQAAVEAPLSTVGCGDAFVGGFIGALCAAVDAGECASIDAASSSEDVLVRGLILATACGAANAHTLGAGRMDPADVEYFKNAVVVRSLA